jgi:hypothetical protein
VGHTSLFTIPFSPSCYPRLFLSISASGNVVEAPLPGSGQHFLSIPAFLTISFSSGSAKKAQQRTMHSQTTLKFFTIKTQSTF